MIWVWIVLLLIVLAILGAYVIYGGKFEMGNNRIDMFKPLEDCSKGQTLSLPLIYDESNGVYTTRVKLGNQNGQGVTFNVIPDLGSSILIVSGEQCRQCNPADGVWNSSLGENINPGTVGTIRYGSQLTRYLPWQAYLLNYPEGKLVNFGVVVDSQSSDGKPMNVMGLTNKKNGFLEGICGEKIISFDFSRGQLHLGQWQPSTPIKHAVPFVESPSGPEFIMSEISQIKINGEPVDTVKYAIWDTGSTDTFLPPDLYNQFISKSPNQTVSITFTNGETISFNSIPKNISSGNLPVANSMLIGNYWMRQHNFIINHEKMIVQSF